MPSDQPSQIFLSSSGNDSVFRSRFCEKIIISGTGSVKNMIIAMRSIVVHFRFRVLSISGSIRVPLVDEL